MRDKLIKLMNKAMLTRENDRLVYGEARLSFEEFADHLIAHGVTLAEDNNVLTNGDRIRAMPDDQFAMFLNCFSVCAVCREAERLDDNPFLKGEKCDEDCEAHILEWLKQPAKEVT